MILFRLPRELIQLVISFLNPVSEEELKDKKREVFDNQVIIDLCKEMGFIPELRTDRTGEYAHPKNLFFFRHRSKFFRKNFYIARTHIDDFCTSLPFKNICRICFTFECKRHQLKNKIVEDYLSRWLQQNYYDFLPIKDKYTNRQFMIFKEYA